MFKFNFFRKKSKLEKSYQECVEAIAEMNKKIAVDKLTEYYADLQTMYGTIDVCPINLAEMVFQKKKAAGQLDKFNRPVRV